MYQHGYESVTSLTIHFWIKFVLYRSTSVYKSKASVEFTTPQFQKRRLSGYLNSVVKVSIVNNCINSKQFVKHRWTSTTDTWVYLSFPSGGTAGLNTIYYFGNSECCIATACCMVATKVLERISTQLYLQCAPLSTVSTYSSGI